MNKFLARNRQIITQPALHLLLAVFFDGLGIGIITTLIPLLLSSQGVSSDVIGWVHSSVALSIILFIGKVSKLSKKFGHEKIINYSALGLVVIMLVSYIWQDPYIWIGLRIFSGVLIAIRWMGLEVWVNIIADDKTRGKLFAIYAGFFSLSVAIGAAITSPIYNWGFLPFGLYCVFLIISIFYVRKIKHLEPSFGEHQSKFWHCITLHKGIYISALACGLLYGLNPMLVLQGKLRDFSDVQSGFHISVFLIGPAIFALQMGDIIDKFPKRFVIAFCGLAIAVFAIPSMIIYIYELSLIGTFILGFMDFLMYSASMSMLGNRYKNEELMAMSATYIIIFEIAAFIGAPLGGYLMKEFSIWGLPVMVVIIGLTSLFILTEKPLKSLK